MDNLPIKQNDSGYSAFTEATKASVVQMHGKSIDRFDAILKPQKALATSLTNDINIRNPFDRRDYDFHRPNERMPWQFRDVIYACRAAYLKIGVVRNVIDMMTDFATEDLQIVHPDKKTEAFFKVWRQKIQLASAVDEFVRHFLVDGNVVVKRTTAKLSKPVESQWMENTAVGAAEPEKLYTENQVTKREIPWRYTFLNVAALHWVGGEAAKMAGERQLAFRLAPATVNLLKSPSEPFQKTIVDALPNNIQNIRKNGSDLVEIDMDTVYVAHNKKDSWEDWAPPFLYAILSDIQFKEKLRQAEISALDGMINVIRLWKLGDHTEGILPNQTAVDKLIGILEANTGGGAMDIVWDSMIEMQEFYPPVEKILGADKFEHVDHDILIGLGVPEVLIGGQGGNFSNSFIQLKTLVEKLEYIRGCVIDWLQTEIALVCKAMDIQVLPKIRFNQMSLEDESVQRKLIIGLLDRGIISVEAVLETYGEDFLLEMERIKGEKNILQQSGVKIKNPLDQKPIAPKAGSKAPVKKKAPGQRGRPLKDKDVTRKTRTPKIRTSASIDLIVFGMDVVDAFDNHILPIYMNSIGTTNARKLTWEQREEINNLRMAVLASIKPSDQIDAESIISLSEQLKPNSKLFNNIEKAIAEYSGINSKAPTLEQRKRIEATVWANYYQGEQYGNI
jgi:hypothetical protein